jgi:hypothetical protein
MDPELLIIDRYLPQFDAAIAQHRIIEAPPPAVFAAVRDLDFATVHTPLLDASFWVRTLPARLRGRLVAPPPHMRLSGVLAQRDRMAERGAGGLRRIPRAGLRQDRLQLLGQTVWPAALNPDVRLPRGDDRRGLATRVRPLLVAGPPVRRPCDAGCGGDRCGIGHPGPHPGDLREAPCS